MSDSESGHLSSKNPGPEANDFAQSGLSAETTGQRVQAGHAGDGPHSPLPDQQKTVISRRPPVDEAALSSLANPLELGPSLEGQQLEHFLLEKFVGGGGMGAVFRALDSKLGRIVAVKVLSRSQSADHDKLQRFRNEAQSAARLDHENIARVYYVGEHEGWNFIVFEFIDGINLRDLVLRNGPLSLDEAVGYTLQVAEALSHAVRRDVVHRDIKPSNVLITGSRRAKLVDMGLARLHQVGATDNDLTASGVTLGTFDYISPEQARDPRSADGRSDIYSLGCTFFFMLTGRPPFPEGTMLQKLLSHTSDDPPDLRQFRPELPDDVVTILNKMLAKRPEQRYQDASELVGDLLLLVERHGLAGSGRAGTVWVTPSEVRLSPIEKHFPWILPVALLAVVVVALEWFWPASNQTGPPGNSPAYQDPRPAAPEVSPVRPKLLGRALPSGGDPPEVSGADPVTTPGASKEVQPEETGDTSPDRHRVPRMLSESPNNSASPRPSTSVGPILSVNVGPADRFDLSPPPTVGEIMVERETGSLFVEGPQYHPYGAPAGEASVPPSAGVATTVLNDSPPPEKVLIVGTSVDAQDQPVFESLAAAVDFATRDEDLASHPVAIELRFNGPSRKLPLLVSAEGLTIRAGEGFAPVLRWQPQTDQPAMITLSGGELTLQDIHIDVTLPEFFVDRWALFGLEDVRLLQLRGCKLTIRNNRRSRRAYHSDVVFFNVLPSPESDKNILQPDGAQTAPLQINLRDCIVRGEATLVGISQARPLRLVWHNGLLVTTEHLLSAGGASMMPRGGGNIAIDLNHVTAITDRGLCRITSDGNAAHQLTISIMCSNSILMTNADAPLIYQRGPGELDALRAQLVFAGKRNFFEHSALTERPPVYWRIETTGKTPQLEELDFRQWDSYWGKNMANLWQEGQVEWHQLPPPTRPVHQLSVADYQMSEHPANPARHAAEDRSDPGFDASRLPAYSVSSLSETSDDGTDKLK